MIQQSHSGYICSKKSESETGTDICIPMFIEALIIIAKRWKQPKGLSTDEWINQMWYICMMELSFSLKKGKTFFNMLNMNEHIMLSEEASHKRTNSMSPLI